MQLYSLERKLRDLRSDFVEEATDFMAKLDTIWREFGALGNAKAEQSKRAALLIGMK